jgi:hypothetical protein
MTILDRAEKTPSAFRKIACYTWDRRIATCRRRMPCGLHGRIAGRSSFPVVIGDFASLQRRVRRFEAPANPA